MKTIFTLLLTTVTALAGSGITGSGIGAGGAIGGVGGSVTAASIAAAGGVTNNQPSAVIGNTLLLNLPSKFYVYGDSLSVRLTTNGWLSHGGLTNSVSGGRTNGLVWYQSSLGGGPWAANNVSMWGVLTNILATQKGRPVELDTAACVPGQLLGGIIGGYTAEQSTYQEQGYSGTYSVNGTYTNLVGNAQTVCWYPLSANDTSVTVTNHGIGTSSTYSCAVGQRVTITIGGAGQARSSYSTIIMNGTPSASMTARVTCPYFQGQGITAAPPWTQNGSSNNGTNNLAPITWAFTNAPTRTGTNAIAILLAGGNDFGSGLVGNAVTFPNSYVSNQYTFVWSNAVLWCQTNKAYGFTVALCTYPLNNYYVSSGVNNRVSSNNICNYNNLIRSNWQTYADLFFDLDLTNRNAGISSTNYIESSPNGVHPNTLFAGIEATNAFLGLKFNLLPLMSYFTPLGTVSNPTNHFLVDTIYTNSTGNRGLLVGAAMLNAAVGGSANITLNYTNNGLAYQLPLQIGSGIAMSDYVPFTVPIAANGTFQFISTMGTGATGYITNAVFWQP